MSTFDPGPPREPITVHEMPAASDVPAIVDYLEQAGLELIGETVPQLCAVCAQPVTTREGSGVLGHDGSASLDRDHLARL